MGVNPFASLSAPVSLALAALFAIAGPAAHAERHLVNGWELHGEISAAPAKETAVQESFPSFFEYQDLVMFHPRFGYYSSGRVNFNSDYQTYPIVLAPYFGQMIAEQMFRMWQGMRQAGTLGKTEPFTIAEFGAGDGSMAESILDYLERQARENPDRLWREFHDQAVYVCYDRSPALSKTQRERNARFNKHFEAREGDATDPTATIAPGSLKGVILSNELPDAFSVHKVILSEDGDAEVGFVAPSLPSESWKKLKKEVPAALAQLVETGDATIRGTVFPGKKDRTYLTRPAFVELLAARVSSKDYASIAESLEFNEMYIPARAIPELAEHLRRYAQLYATELAKRDGGVVTYINLGVEKFIQGAARILSAGYVITLDYGDNWEGIIAQDSHPHFRTYGPAHQEQNRQEKADDGDQTGEERDTSDPYRGPTLNDMTTDVNFSLMEAEGRLAGLTTAYFGGQFALQRGTPVSLEEAPPDRADSPALEDEFYSWASNFKTDRNYKLMVQQKLKTDAAYLYPEEESERLASDPDGLNEPQREKAARIEKRLSAGSR